ncbi:hypothetical protein LINPERPRIM_LOCUS5232 [Linum perenne]
MIRLRLYEALSPNRRLPFDLPTRSSLLLFHQLQPPAPLFFLLFSFFLSFLFPSFFLSFLSLLSFLSSLFFPFHFLFPFNDPKNKTLPHLFPFNVRAPSPTFPFHYHLHPNHKPTHESDQLVRPITSAH